MQTPNKKSLLMYVKCCLITYVTYVCCFVGNYIAGVTLVSIGAVCAFVAVIMFIYGGVASEPGKLLLLRHCSKTRKGMYFYVVVIKRP